MAAKALARPKAILATWSHDGRQPCTVLNAQRRHETHVNVSLKIVSCSALRVYQTSAMQTRFTC